MTWSITKVRAVSECEVAKKLRRSITHEGLLEDEGDLVIDCEAWDYFEWRWCGVEPGDL